MALKVLLIYLICGYIIVNQPDIKLDEDLEKIEVEEVLNISNHNQAKEIDKTYIEKTNTGYIIGWNYDENNKMYIAFENVGINQLFSISNLYILPNEIDKDIKSVINEDNMFLKTGTDWIGPYQVSETKMEKKQYKFTGGWHGSNGDGTGDITAKTIDVKVFVDDKDYTNKLADEIKFIVTNLIKSCDTQEFVLKETVSYKICDGKIYVQVNIEPLKNIVINQYYGLQSFNKSWTNTVSYLSTERKRISYPTMANSHSDKLKANPTVSKIILQSLENQHYLEVSLDRQYGLGKMEYVSEELPAAFTMNYGKSYFNLINGKEKTLKKGEVVSWRGSYKFYNEDR